MSRSPDDLLNRLSLTFVVDGNVYDEVSNAALRLSEMEVDRWILLQSTFVILDELAATTDNDKRDRMLDEVAGRPVGLDVWVLGYGRLDQIILGGDADVTLSDRLWQVVKPGVDRATGRDSHHRDVIALHTAIRSLHNGFVTWDRQLLAKAAAVKAEFGGFLLLDPEECVALVERRITRYLRRTNGQS